MRRNKNKTTISKIDKTIGMNSNGGSASSKSVERAHRIDIGDLFSKMRSLLSSGPRLVERIDELIDKLLVVRNMLAKLVDVEEVEIEEID